MDIAALSIGMSQNAVNTAASIALLKMQMNTGEETSNNLLEMAKTMAVEPGKGLNLDKYV
ncbi:MULTISPECIES: YjfB family protein [Clostridia]|uniref:YjfB family protein n=2 Tax=Clostridia TaxID=186801 RepID=A0A8I0DMF3_9CLOT|nr:MULTISPECIES: YjfB family protein [Clostridia]MBC5639279.1 YjfB family protein [Clostridium lentum]MBC5653372.1 YjfB family protein [Blautia lenta]